MQCEHFNRRGFARAVFAEQAEDFAAFNREIYFVDGKRFGDGKKYCNILEDEDRGLTNDMSVDEILAKKKYGETAIPTGRYEVKISWSPKFKKDMPILIAVKGFTGIRIHSGNTAKDSLGCLLVGENSKVGMITNSRYWTTLLTAKIKTALDSGDTVYIKVG